MRWFATVLWLVAFIGVGAYLVTHQNLYYLAFFILGWATGTTLVLLIAWLE